MLGLKILHTVCKAMRYYCSRVNSCIELQCLQCHFGTAGYLLWLQAQCATCFFFFFFNKMEKAGTEKVCDHQYKGCQEGGILLIWILELTANIYEHDPEWRVQVTEMVVIRQLLLKDPSLNYQWRKYCVSQHCSRMMCHWRR